VHVLSLNGFDWKQLSFTVVGMDLEVWEVGRTTQIWHLILSPICRTSVQDFGMIVVHLV